MGPSSKINATGLAVRELPYAGINRVRFQGYFSARSIRVICVNPGTPSRGYTVPKAPAVCNRLIPNKSINILFNIDNMQDSPAGLLPARRKPRTLGRLCFNSDGESR